jgi:DNA replication protein DnaC
LQEFYRALPQAKLDEDKKVLTLSDNTVFPGTFELNKIYIRDCYSDLYELVMNSDIHSTLITGTPGIGKSICAFYFMWRLLSEGKTVIYQQDDEYYRLGDGGVFRGTWETFFDARFFDDKVT